MVQVLEGWEPSDNIKPTTQVYKVTHEGDGNRLPFAKRSFISFSFGGKVIEDYNLIAYNTGDAVERSLYANFEDITETYDVIDGQFYWGTHFTNFELTLNLVTDSIDDKTLDDFKQWFCPGIARELVLAEHPNRAIMARIANPPTYSLMPFEKKISKIIGGQTYNDISVTEYKGTIQINFVADDPFWYARYNVLFPYMNGEGILGIIPVTGDPYLLKKLIEENFTEKELYIKYKNDNNEQNVISLYQPTITIENGYWSISGISTEGINVNLSYPQQILSLMGSAVTLEDKDFLKIIIEDNIPHLEMIKEDCLFGEDIYVSGSPESRVFNTTQEVIDNLLPSQGARVGAGMGRIADYEERTITSTIDITPTAPGYLYYAGTAPSKPVIQFDFIPQFEQVKEGEMAKYIVEPLTSLGEDNHYSYLAIDDEYFEFTTPSILTAYNKAISIMEEFDENGSVPDLLRKIKDNVNEYHTRAWAIQAIDSIFGDKATINEVTDSDPKESFYVYMKSFLCGDNGMNPIHVVFSSKSGEAYGLFKVQEMGEIIEPILPPANRSTYDENDTTLPTYMIEGKKFYLAPGIQINNKTDIKLNVGDMIKSKFLIIDGRNNPNYEGFITHKDCHKVTTNYSSGLQNLEITYKNLYY